MKKFSILWASPFLMAALVSLSGCSGSCQQDCDCTYNSEVGYRIIQSSGCSSVGGAYQEKWAQLNNVDKFAKMCAKRCRDVDHRGKFKGTPEPPPKQEPAAEKVEVVGPPSPPSPVRKATNHMKNWEVEL
jgi:hypothetical protein